MDILSFAKLYRRTIRQNHRVDEDYAAQRAKSLGMAANYNWWQDGCYLWFVRRYEHLAKQYGKRIAFCSVFGNSEIIKRIPEVKVFFSGENVHRHPYEEYADYLLKGNLVDLSLGFDLFEDERYLRFPLWLLYTFSPESTEQDIKDICNKLRFPNMGERDRFCCMIASHDANNIRHDIVEALSEIQRVDCAGRYMHNDDSLLNRYQDDKIAYLRSFMFNICPENSNSMGYVTEKIFDSINAGCVPIYWGSYNEPEPNILNQDAILFWQANGDNESQIKFVSDLLANPKAYEDLFMQPRLIPGAEEEIMSMFAELDKRIVSLLTSK